MMTLLTLRVISLYFLRNIAGDPPKSYQCPLDMSFHFERGETIQTENSYKFNMRQTKDIARASGFTLKEHFMDGKKLFCFALFPPS
jgi:uncharacterized SAM-dependent methyltransferase